MNQEAREGLVRIMSTTSDPDVIEQALDVAKRRGLVELSPGGRPREGVGASVREDIKRIIGLLENFPSHPFVKEDREVLLLLLRATK